MKPAGRDRDATPEVSVVISCCNYGRYVAGCIESVLSQTYQGFEIVIVNDGSTDNSEQEILRFLPDPRIRYIGQANGGQAKAKNAGIRHSRGRYIAFLDADDRWASQKLEKQMPLFSEPGIGVVFSRAGYIDGEGTEVAFAHRSKHLRPHSGRVTKALLFDNFIPFSSSVVRQECLDKVGVFDESLGMAIDWDLWLRISVEYEFGFADEELISYRLGHPGQMSRAVEARYACTERIIKRFLTEHPKEFSRALLKKAWLYTCSNKGLFYRDTDLALSTRWYLRGMRGWPFGHSAYKGLIKNALIYFRAQSFH